MLYNLYSKTNTFSCQKCQQYNENLVGESTQSDILKASILFLAFPRCNFLHFALFFPLLAFPLEGLEGLAGLGGLEAFINLPPTSPEVLANKKRPTFPHILRLTFHA